MRKDHVPQGRTSVFERSQKNRQQSTSLSSFQVNDQQQKNRDTFIKQIPNNNNNNNNKRSK
jgi:hypothetical protein